MKQRGWQGTCSSSAFSKKGNKMNDRILVKVNVLKDEISLKTVSRNFKAPHFFYILKERFLELEDGKSIVVNHCGSFAELSRMQLAGQEILQATFSWLEEEADGEVTGWRETVRLPYDRFYHAALENKPNGEWKMLSMMDNRSPMIRFESRCNLHNVARNPRVKKKLGRFLSNHFQWRRSQQIVLYDECPPFSFWFEEYRNEGMGMSGAVILHGQRNLKTAYYGIHT